MVRRPLFAALVVLTLLLALGCSKAPVIVTVDMDKLANDSKEAQAIKAEVESFAKSVEDQLDKGAQQIQAAAADPKADPRKVNEMKMQFSQILRQAEEEVDNRRKQAVDRVHGKVGEALNVLAKEKGWDMVIRSGPQSAMWADGSLDVTGIVVERMDKAPQANPQQ